MPEDIDLIIFELKEIEAKIGEFLRLYDRGDEQLEKQLKLLLERINGAAILYGNIVRHVLDIEAKSQREMNLRQLLVPTSFEGGWYYVPHSRLQTESKGIRQPSVPNRSEFLPEAE